MENYQMFHQNVCKTFYLVETYKKGTFFTQGLKFTSPVNV